jgi:nitroimidazol reductase NimA-like FMN-containing flavoprotein (pyridoxamine 5'-phosphate oxidase superfamily)
MRDYSKASPTDLQRLPEYKRDDAWIRAFLHRSPIAHIGHLSTEQPFVTPTNFWYDQAKEQIIFHSNLSGRLRYDLELNPQICLETSEFGRLLPSNAALEFSIQYRSVMVFGKVHILENDLEIRRALEGLLAKYFPRLRSGIEFRPITDKELARTSVYALSIESWSGKENWQEAADMIDDWPSLPADIH